MGKRRNSPSSSVEETPSSLDPAQKHRVPIDQASARIRRRITGAVSVSLEDLEKKAAREDAREQERIQRYSEQHPAKDTPSFSERLKSIAMNMHPGPKASVDFMGHIDHIVGILEPFLADFSPGKPLDDLAVTLRQCDAALRLYPERIALGQTIVWLLETDHHFAPHEKQFLLALFPPLTHDEERLMELKTRKRLDAAQRKRSAEE